ncbi:MAG: hypothetical protein GYB55_22450 [Cytophagales bacterium]|uniref:toxin-antitoxin system YwqK family antitoxin n=1 Tax=Cyclobacterium marinum TaxID=104 RepID=UPI0030DC8B79|nr:hypothetical protein [Cytophagales bacterium]|tara:strand:- start:4249 stop:5538 length:1290 start_codon:yes stop_codon:yes gene_type:complete
MVLRALILLAFSFAIVSLVQAQVKYNRVVFKPSPYVEYHANGNIYKKGFVNANKQFVDTLAIFFPSEKLSMTAVYDNGVPNGLCIHYNKDGSISREGLYVQGKKDGLWVYNNYATSKKGLPYRFSVNYKNGQLHGETILYEGTHKIRSIHAFLGKPAPNKKWEMYYDNSDNLLAVGFISSDNQFTLRGIYTEDGEFVDKVGVSKEKTEIFLEAMRSFFKSIPKQEKKTATKVTYETKTVTHKSVPFSTYLANGKIHEKGYRNAKEQLVGKLLTYYTSGTLKSEMHYFNGVLQGDCTHYNEEGTIKMQGKYAKGKKEGLWIYPDYIKNNEARFSYKVHYKNGLLHGETLFIKGDEKLILMTASEGVLLGKWESYYPNGFPSSSGLVSAAGDVLTHKVFDKEGKRMVTMFSPPTPENLSNSIKDVFATIPN